MYYFDAGTFDFKFEFEFEQTPRGFCSRSFLIGEFFFPNFDIFFAQNFNIPYVPVFFPKYWNVNKIDIFGSGEFHEY